MAADITVEELRKLLTHTDLVSGFANRFLFVCTRRSKLLPHGGSLADDALEALVARLREAMKAARKVGRVKFDRPARSAWEEMYMHLSADRSGTLAAATQRAAPQVLRLSIIYSLFDGSGTVRLDT